jgi:hypothetical protein
LRAIRWIFELEANIKHKHIIVSLPLGGLVHRNQGTEFGYGHDFLPDLFNRFLR